MPRFGNKSHKISLIIKTFENAERQTGEEIKNRLKVMGYKISVHGLKMFIFYNMKYKHLDAEKVKKKYKSSWGEKIYYTLKGS